MINLYPTINKLERLQEALSDPLATFENQLQAVMDFKRFDLEGITLDLRAQQYVSDQELDGLEQLEFNAEHEGVDAA